MQHQSGAPEAIMDGGYRCWLKTGVLLLTKAPGEASAIPVRSGTVRLALWDCTTQKVSTHHLFVSGICLVLFR